MPTINEVIERVERIKPVANVNAIAVETDNKIGRAHV